MTEHVYPNGGHPIPQEQYRFLERWLLEWELGKRMADLHVVDPDLSPDFNLPQVCDRGNTPIKHGDILLLSPFVLPQATRPVYLAVLSAWDSGRWLIAPYSAFSVPATTGELLTGRDDFPLKTLCLWNALDIDEEILNRAWWIGAMSGEELNESWNVFRHVATGSDLPDELKHRIGPPVLHPNDPRCEYQQWESTILRGLDRSVLGGVINPKIQVLDCRKPYLRILENKEENNKAVAFINYGKPYSLAADDADRRIPLKSFSIPFDIDGQLAEITVRKSVKSGYIALVVSGDLQNRCATVSSASGRELATMRDGEARIRAKDVGDHFTILDGMGNHIVMIKIR